MRKMLLSESPLNFRPNHVVWSYVLYAPRLHQAVRTNLSTILKLRTFLVRIFLVVPIKGAIESKLSLEFIKK